MKLPPILSTLPRHPHPRHWRGSAPNRKSRIENRKSPALLTLRLAFLAALLPALPAHAAPDDLPTGPDYKTLTFQNGAGGYTGAVDVLISKSTSNAPNPKGPVFWLSRELEEGTRRHKNETAALLRFDRIFGDAPGQIPPGSPITKAVLRLRTDTSDAAGTSHRLHLNRMLLPWDTTAAWRNPAWGRDGIQTDNREALADPDNIGTFNQPNTDYELDVTPALRAWSSGAANHGWLLHMLHINTVNQLALATTHSSSVKKRPALTVTYDTRPANRAPAATAATAPTAAGAVAPPIQNPESKIQNSTATLSLRADDPDGDPLTVTFHARRRPAAARDFSIITLPDTQYYTHVPYHYGGSPEMFYAQTDWIIRYARPLNIAAVLHLGDISDQGDFDRQEWIYAARAMYPLGDPAATGRPDGIPCILAIGNHDQRDETKTWGGPARLFNEYFGIKHFSQKSYYGGHFGNDNNNYYILFDSGPEKFLVLSLEYDFDKRNPGKVIKWADGILKKHAGRRAIIITHATVHPGQVQAAFCKDGGGPAYEGLKSNKNLMLIIGGHITGEGRRTDTHNGSTVHSILMDFQFDGNGGNGLLGILTLSPRTNKIHVSTYSPHAKSGRLDASAAYTLDYDFGAQIEPFVKIKTETVPAGATVTCRLENMDPSATYEWRAEIADPGKTTHLPARPIPPPQIPSPR
jgi:hypothetical protein